MLCDRSHRFTGIYTLVMSTPHNTSTDCKQTASSDAEGLLSEPVLMVNIHCTSAKSHCKSSKLSFKFGNECVLRMTPHLTWCYHNMAVFRTQVLSTDREEAPTHCCMTKYKAPSWQMSIEARSFLGHYRMHTGSWWSLGVSKFISFFGAHSWKKICIVTKCGQCSRLECLIALNELCFFKPWMNCAKARHMRWVTSCKWDYSCLHILSFTRRPMAVK